MENKKQHTVEFKMTLIMLRLHKAKAKAKAKLKKRTQTLKNDAKLKIVF